MQGKSMKGKNKEQVFNDYEGFIEKFKPKKTTDDCYTPKEVYECIRDWVCEKFSIEESNIVRPFYPGGDYQKFNYPNNCIVLDNPPFSILSEIQAFYKEKGIKYFLFCQTMTAISTSRRSDSCIIFCDAQIVYENGAKIDTCFIHDLNDIKISTEPELGIKIKEANKQDVAKLPKYKYPSNMLTSSKVNEYARKGIKISINKKECEFIRQLEGQKPLKKVIYGGGLLISDDATERIRIEQVKGDNKEFHEFKLSDKELNIVEKLNKKE